MGIKEYVDQAKKFFNDTHNLMAATNHEEHNPNKDYWEILLGDIKNNPDRWNGKSAFDFGCGCGRNLKNLASLAKWNNLHGCDISKHNAAFSMNYMRQHSPIGAMVNCWESDGISIRSMDGLLPCIKYDFIMSTIVLEHIPSYTIRKNILTSIYEGLDDEGLFSLSLSNLSIAVDYYEDHYEFPMNGRINNPEAIKKDLQEIGFKDVEIIIGSNFQGRNWSYVKALK